MKISIPQPCHENWNEMLPEEKGRFCLSCQKSVIDFTKISDKEVIDLIQKPNQCGRFSTIQLNRINLKLEQQNQFQFPRFLRYSPLLISLGFGGNLVAQEKEKIEVIENFPKSDFEKNDSFKLLKGQVLDKEGNPNPDILITLRGFPEISTYTDENGIFELKVPNDYVYVVIIEDPFGSVLDKMIYPNKFNLIECCEIELSTGPVVIARKRTFAGKTLRTLAWPFRQIGKLF